MTSLCSVHLECCRLGSMEYHRPEEGVFVGVPLELIFSNVYCDLSVSPSEPSSWLLPRVRSYQTTRNQHTASALAPCSLQSWWMNERSGVEVEGREGKVGGMMGSK